MSKTKKAEIGREGILLLIRCEPSDEDQMLDRHPFNLI